MLDELIKRCKKGEQRAQRILFDRYYGQMYRVCLRYMREEMLAEDRLSEGFIKVFKHISGFEYEHENALQAWIKKIMINECLMFLRKKNNFHLVPLTEAEAITVQDIHLEHIDAHYIYQCLAELPAGYRTVLNLYLIEGYSHAEIGRLLNIREATSRSQLNKAKEALKQKLLPYNTVHYGKKQL